MFCNQCEQVAKGESCTKIGVCGKEPDVAALQEFYAGQIDDGVWIVDGERSKNPSDAAGSVAKTRAGESPSLNGWVYWQVKRPGDTSWVALNSLRPT